MTKEQIYDEQISPLMTQILALVQAHKIPMHAAFQLDGDLGCTSHFAPKEEEVSEDDWDGFAAWEDKYQPLANRAARRPVEPMMVNVRDKDGNVTESHVYL